MSPKQKRKITVIDGGVRLLPQDIKELKKLGEVSIYFDQPRDQQVRDRLQKTNIVVFDHYPMPATAIAAAPRLEMICIAGSGYDGRVDLEACRRRIITVCNAPDYATESVAQHTIGLMLNAARWISTADRDIRQHQWKPGKYKGVELQRKTLGIIGHGKIGSRVAEIAKKGLGMNVISVNSKSSRQELEILLEQSDVLSLHVPINEKTRGMLGKKEFRLMKPGIILVNTARGKIIAMEVLLDNLSSGKVFAAGLDVFPEEPLPPEHPVRLYPNVIIIPHIASHTKEAERRLSQTILDNVSHFLNGHPINVVNEP